MAIEKLHYNQYKSNKMLLDMDIFESSTSKYLDWAITIAFYGALHLVEKKLCEINSNHSKNHFERNNNVRTMVEFKNIRVKYNTLYWQSRRARYQCCNFTKQDVSDALKLLSEIEQDLENTKGA